MSLLRALFDIPEAPPPFDSFAAFWARHRALVAGERRPVVAAVRGGVHADRLAAAFAAGYQAALRALVPDLPSASVASFCVTERGGGHPRAIEATLVTVEGGSLKLRGHKRWATLSTEAGVLLVVAKTGDDPETGRPLLRVARVDSTAPGVRLSPMPPTPFVPEIPHGQVFLDDVTVRDEDLLPGDGYTHYVKPFRTIEDVHVHAAALAYVAAEATWCKLGRPFVERCAALIASLGEIASAHPLNPAAHVALAGVLAQTRQLAEAVEGPWSTAAPDRHARFVRDRGLFGVAEGARADRLTRAWEQIEAGYGKNPG
jgi:alkylation response protein AidB-like acyl-CoA dehydrogenase